MHDPIGAFDDVGNNYSLNSKMHEQICRYPDNGCPRKDFASHDGPGMYLTERTDLSSSYKPGSTHPSFLYLSVRTLVLENNTPTPIIFMIMVPIDSDN